MNGIKLMIFGASMILCGMSFGYIIFGCGDHPRLVSNISIIIVLLSFIQIAIPNKKKSDEVNN